MDLQEAERRALSRRSHAGEGQGLAPLSPREVMGTKDKPSTSRSAMERACRRQRRLILALVLTLCLQLPIVLYYTNTMQWTYERVIFGSQWEANLVRPGTYVGGIESAKSWEGLKEHGITAILNAGALKFDVQYPDVLDSLSIDLEDRAAQDIISFLPVAHRWIEEKLAAGHVILLHCESGLSRSVTILASYLMRTERLTWARAVAEVRKVRRLVNPNLGLAYQARVYRKILSDERNKFSRARAIAEETANDKYPRNAESSYVEIGKNPSFIRHMRDLHGQAAFLPDQPLVPMEVLLGMLAAMLASVVSAVAVKLVCC